MDRFKLNEQLLKIEKEIKKIQNECSHKNQEMKFTDGFIIRWVCKYCQKPVAWPTEEESKNWLK